MRRTRPGILMLVTLVFVGCGDEIVPEPSQTECAGPETSCPPPNTSPGFTDDEGLDEQTEPSSGGGTTSGLEAGEHQVDDSLAGHSPPDATNTVSGDERSTAPEATGATLSKEDHDPDLAPDMGGIDNADDVNDTAHSAGAAIDDSVGETHDDLRRNPSHTDAGAEDDDDDDQAFDQNDDSGDSTDGAAAAGAHDMLVDDEQARDDVSMHDDEALESAGAPEEADPAAEWTVMFYMAADNGRSDAIQNALAIIADFVIAPEIKVVAQMDTATGPAQRYVLADGQWTIVTNLGEVDMADIDVVRDFITWAKTEHDSDRRALVVMDGGTAIRGISRDHTEDGTRLEPRGFSTALTQALGNDRFDLIALDGSFTANLETAYSLREVTRFLVASQEMVPVEGAPFGEWLTGLSDAADGASAARDLVGLFAERYVGADAAHLTPYATLSVIDLEGVVPLKVALDALSTHLLEALEAGDAVDALAQVRARTPSFIGPGKAQIDLQAFLLHLNAEIDLDAAQFAENALVTLESAIMERVSGRARPFAGGLSIFFPQLRPLVNPTRAERYANLDFAEVTRWDELLHAYTAMTAEDRLLPTGEFVQLQYEGEQITVRATSHNRDTVSASIHVRDSANNLGQGRIRSVWPARVDGSVIHGVVRTREFFLYDGTPKDRIELELDGHTALGAARATNTVLGQANVRVFSAGTSVGIPAIVLTESGPLGESPRVLSILRRSDLTPIRPSIDTVLTAQYKDGTIGVSEPTEMNAELPTIVSQGLMHGEAVRLELVLMDANGNPQRIDLETARPRDGEGGTCDTHRACDDEQQLCLAGGCFYPYPGIIALTAQFIHVARRDPNGDAWDLFGGAPDPYARLFINDRVTLDKSRTVDDSFVATLNKTWFTPISPDDTVSICFYDEDIDQADTINCFEMDTDKMTEIIRERDGRAVYTPEEGDNAHVVQVELGFSHPRAWPVSPAVQ